jgi:hypothetical protein
MAQFDKEKDNLQQEALQAKRQAAMKKFVDGLKARSKVAIDQSFLEET